MLNAGEDGKGLEKEKKKTENLSGAHFKIQVRYFSKIFLQKIVILIFTTWSFDHRGWPVFKAMLLGHNITVNLAVGFRMETSLNRNVHKRLLL